MFTEHSTFVALNGALLLPMMLLYLLFFLNYTNRKLRFDSSRPIVSVRDAATASIALDIAAITDFAVGGWPPSPARIILIAVLLVALISHIFALHAFMRKSSAPDDEGGSSPPRTWMRLPREPVSEALAKLESRPPSGFAVRLTSLYVATLILITNGTTVLAVLEFVRTGR